METIQSRMGLCCFMLLLLALVPCLTAHIGQYDPVWQERAKKAREATLKAYEPHPEKVIGKLNKAVAKALNKTMTSPRLKTEARKYKHALGDKKYKNSTLDTHQKVQGKVQGRRLRVNHGPCLATNPIDRCWRCRKNWMRNRKRLAKCVLGFGRKTVGGLYGSYYLVTDPSDKELVNPDNGTLRHAVIQEEPLWIVFERDMVIRLSEELIVNSHKTIDARGHNIHIAHGAGITVQFVKNVIIEGLHIHDIKSGGGGNIRDSPAHYGVRTKSDGDGISVFGSSDIWIDHLSMSGCMDGLIDVVQGSTAITISNCHFTHHNDVMLMGASDSQTLDEKMQVTIAFNHFGRGLVQRMPRCRFGFFHVVNNDYTHWNMYAIGGSMHPTILSHGNRYVAPHISYAKEVTKREYATEDEWKHWIWKSHGDLLLNGAFFVESGSDNWRRFSKKDVISSRPGSYVGRLTRYAGALNCRSNMAC